MGVHPFLCFRCPHFGVTFFSVFSLQFTSSLPFFLGGGHFYLICSSSIPTPLLSIQHLHTVVSPDLSFVSSISVGKTDIFRFKSQPPCPPVATSAVFLSFPAPLSFFSVFLLSFLPPSFSSRCFPSSVSASCSSDSQRQQKHHALLCLPSRLVRLS